MMIGAIGGCVAGIVSWLIFAAQYEGGLAPEVFIMNTGKEFPMLIGNMVSIVGGAVLSIIVSLVTRGPLTKEEIEAEWEKTRDIDNPLTPWVQVYKDDLKLVEGVNFHDRPALEIIVAKFKNAKITAYTAGILFTILFVFIWPCVMLSVNVLSMDGFDLWTVISKGWAFIAAAFIIIVPFAEEVWAIRKQYKENKIESEKGIEYIL
jgi:urea-proton symporter